MTWASFAEYTQMVLAGQDDAVTRNYDLANLNGTKPGVMLDRAAQRMGLAQYHTPRSQLTPLIHQMLLNVGIRHGMDNNQFEDHIRAWYIWDRILKEEVRQWPMKPTSFSLI